MVRVEARGEERQAHASGRYCVTSLDGGLYCLLDTVPCARGQAENLIKLHKTQLASDRFSGEWATIGRALWCITCDRPVLFRLPIRCFSVVSRVPPSRARRSNRGKDDLGPGAAPDGCRGVRKLSSESDPTLLDELRRLARWCSPRPQCV
jgi:hypothetical protein